jgi:uncharacterized protein YjiS (DUF1127 family)
MSTPCDTTGSPRTFAPIKLAGFFERFRVAFREWRERRRLHATLSGLSDRELLDIGTTRGEIDYQLMGEVTHGTAERNFSSSICPNDCREFVGTGGDGSWSPHLGSIDKAEHRLHPGR